MQHSIVSEDKELSLEPTAISSAAPAIRKGLKIASDTAPSIKIPKASSAGVKGDSSVGAISRSGREYYDKWEKVAAEELKKIDSEDSSQSQNSKLASDDATPISTGIDMSIDLANKLHTSLAVTLEVESQCHICDQASRFKVDCLITYLALCGLLWIARILLSMPSSFTLYSCIEAWFANMSIVTHA